MRKLVSAAVIAAMLGSTPAFAKDMDCIFNKDYAKFFDKMEFDKKGTHYRLFVRDTYSGVPDSIHTKDYNRSVQVKWGMDKPSSTKTNVMVRPRSSTDCLVAITDEKGKKIWTSTGYCRTDKHTETGSHLDMSVVEDPKLPDAYKGVFYATGGGVSTYTKVSVFLSFYVKKASNKFEQIGGCVEDK